MKKRVLSGVQATGNLHLGNYLGAIKNWHAMQDSHECFFFLADLHAITIDVSRDALRDSAMEAIAAYLASGIDPQKSVLFAQSSISEHAELAWILNCFTPMGWLSRMTQFKDKAGKSEEKANLGLFSYPVLMAADILLYHADLVPVGSDQKQHIELTRDIAGAMNRKFGCEMFKIPDHLTSDSASRIMSLRDGSKKMSKSDPSDYSRINFSDDADMIAQKIKKAKTDSYQYISYDKTTRPEVSNLIDIYAALADKSVSDIVDMYSSGGFSSFKGDLVQIVVDKLSPITTKYREYINDKSYLISILNSGAQRAKVVAEKTLKQVYDAIGYIDYTRH